MVEYIRWIIGTALYVEIWTMLTLDIFVLACMVKGNVLGLGLLFLQRKSECFERIGF